MTQFSSWSRWSLPVFGSIVSSITLFAIAPEAEAAGFYFDAFQSNDLTSIDLVGDVKTDGATFRLTEAEQEWHAAAAWHREGQDITGGFETTFSFQISDLRAADNFYNGNSVVDRNGEIGGDGFAFVIRNASSSALGGHGGAQGYSGIADALAIEFDTWDNSQDFETWGGGVAEDYGLESSNHISVQGLTEASYGEYPRYSLGYTDDIANLSSGEVHQARIRYEDSRLSIFLNRSLALEVEDLDLSELVGADTAMLGFTAGTGAAWQTNDILDWSYESLGQSRRLLSQPPRAVPEPSGLLALFGLFGAAAGQGRSGKRDVAIASPQTA